MSRHTPPKRPQRFANKGLNEIAPEDCERPYSKQSAVRTQCPVCEWDLFLHCIDCKIQITGCLCTAIERMNQDDLREFMAQLDERRRREAIAKGLWTPENN